MLLGAIVSSTDAAAVFAVLRNSGLVLKRRVGVTLELESGLNDPVAVILTMAFTGALVTGEPAGWRLVLDVVTQLAIGAGLGGVIGHGARALLGRARLPTGGLYPVLTVAVACLAFGLPTLMAGSGFLAVYVTAIILGAGPLPHRLGLLRVHDAIAWFAQVAMFVLLGLLAFPSRVLQSAPLGLALALCLAIVARPVVVALCLAPFRYPLKESAFVGWVGLRGAVPIILATYPVMAGAPGADRIFDIVFSIVVVGTFIPGSTVAWLTRRLDLEAGEPPRPRAVVEIESSEPLNADVLSFYVEPDAAVAGARMADLPFPPGAAAMLVVRGRELIAPRGGTVLQPGDHVFVCARREDQGTVHLLFGRMEQNTGEETVGGEEV
jgi:cell volume regulation protein A